MLLVAVSTVLAVRALLGSPHATPRSSVVPRVIELAARLPVPAGLARAAAVTPAALAAAGWVPAEVADELADHYRHHREVE
ncbi:MAG: hypothetical protein KDC33_12740, partial [Thermoleophilia bacterium]|nr:hypothetical protein [Thermoleophilia bacterium]